MRVIVNGLSCSGSKTGVGHYTTQLLRCLQAQRASEDIVDMFPQGIVGRLYNFKALLQKRLQRAATFDYPHRRAGRRPVGLSFP